MEAARGDTDHEAIAGDGSDDVGRKICRRL